jgi:DNA-directed RNA polymerase subunit RPC12/RpoP
MYLGNIMRLNPARKDHSGRWGFHCFRCGYEWRRRKPGTPLRTVRCPKCGNRKF